jgi:hydrogenase assembly chaperone HypC/HupF
MCLSVPGKVTSIKDGVATIDYGSEKREAGTALLSDITVGEYVIVSAKMILQRVPAEEAEAILAMWDETDRDQNPPHKRDSCDC